MAADGNIGSQGFDVVAFDDGGLIARVAAQTCLYNQIRTLITWNAPHGGHYSSSPGGIEAIYGHAGQERAKALSMLVAGGSIGEDRGQNYDMYSEFVQMNSAVSGYWRDPGRLNHYASSSFLAFANAGQEICALDLFFNTSPWVCYNQTIVRLIFIHFNYFCRAMWSQSDGSDAFVLARGPVTTLTTVEWRQGVVLEACTRGGPRLLGANVAGRDQVLGSGVGARARGERRDQGGCWGKGRMQGVE